MTCDRKELTEKEKIAKEICELSGVEFRRSGQPEAWNSPHLGLIDRNQPPNYANVMVVLHCLSGVSERWGLGEFRTVTPGPDALSDILRLVKEKLAQERESREYRRKVLDRILHGIQEPESKAS